MRPSLQVMVISERVNAMKYSIVASATLNRPGEGNIYGTVPQYHLYHLQGALEAMLNMKVWKT